MEYRQFLDKYAEALRSKDLTFRHGVYTCLAAYLALKTGNIIKEEGFSGLIKRFSGMSVALIRSIPGGSEAIDAGIQSALASVADNLAPVDPTAVTEIPSEKRNANMIIETLKRLINKDLTESQFVSRHKFSGIYHHVDSGVEGSLSDANLEKEHTFTNPGDELSFLQRTAQNLYLNTNALYPGVFKSGRKMEAEVVAMVVNMLKGAMGSSRPQSDLNPTACGMMTSGGTESIILAFKVLRDAALDRLGIKPVSPVVPGAKPDLQSTASAVGVAEAYRRGIVLRVIAGETCHPALDKACSYLGLALVKLPVDPITRELRPEDVKAALHEHTLAVYTSAPTFPHGVVDPIPEIASICLAYKSGVFGTEGVPVHVDNCLGGVVLSFLYEQQEARRRSGKAPTLPELAPIPAFDFRVPGVVTISCDVHKYGSAPKGASIVAFANDKLRRFAYTSVPEFPGGLYTTPTIAGSRSAAPAAAAWSTLLYYGADGYKHMALGVETVMNKVIEEVKKVDGLKILGKTTCCIVSFTADDKANFSPFALAARMEERGWQLPMMQNPDGLHIAVTERLSDETILNAWLADLRQCVELCKQNPNDPNYKGKGAAGIYGASSVLPAKEVSGILSRYCDVLYLVRK